MAFKRELIVNNGSLTSYKKLLKVSDVCQLLDKRKYPATTTMNGVTYTNNGDGTISLKGTRGATGDSYYRITWTQNIIKEHVYCLLGVIKDSGVEQYCLSVTGGKTLYDRGSGDIETNLIDRRELIISLPANTTVDTIVKPQLFDLTEMFGPGNEPKTVAEFKAKFPNELYDYSPRCWVTSYKTGLIAKTKNLFNINKLTAYTPETLPTNTAGRYNGNIITKCVEGSSVSKSNKLLKELCPNLVAGERYILHFDTNGTGPQADIIYLNGTDTIWVKGYAHVVTEAELNDTVFFYGNYPSLDVATISNFQIEKGTTATDYVPYGYL